MFYNYALRRFDSVIWTGYFHLRFVIMLYFGYTKMLEYRCVYKNVVLCVGYWLNTVADRSRRYNKYLDTDWFCLQHHMWSYTHIFFLYRHCYPWLYILRYIISKHVILCYLKNVLYTKQISYATTGLLLAKLFDLLKRSSLIICVVHDFVSTFQEELRVQKNEVLIFSMTSGFYFYDYLDITKRKN